MYETIITGIKPGDKKKKIRVTKDGHLLIADQKLEISQGNIPGQTTVNKFGRSTNVDAVSTDLWDRANPTDDQDIWVAPTQARIHNIVSSSANDILGGSGARTIRIFGLKNWNDKEIWEDKNMDGTDDVATENEYVIIHRIKVLTKGATSINVGKITATAQVDGTVTAQINAGLGQTQMAIYGIPSAQIGYMTQFLSSVRKSGGNAGSADVDLLVNSEPDSELTNFRFTHASAPNTTGSSFIPHTFNPYLTIPGPAIVKVQAIGSTVNLEISGDFDIILVDR